MELNVIYAGEVINGMHRHLCELRHGWMQCDVMYGENVTYDKNVIYDARGVSL
jgi:hypothetical protein